MFKPSGITNPYHYGDDTINIMAHLGRFTNRWPYFMIGLISALILAFIQIKTSTRVYKVGTKIIVSEKEKSDLHDLLVSPDLVRETVKGMGTTIAYFRENSFQAKPEYENRFFTIKIDSSALQMIGLDIYIELLNRESFRVIATGDEIKLYDPKNYQVVGLIDEVEIDEVVSVGQRFQNEH
ncbi:MAG: hypothetical protein KDD63_15445, partial [Bacteroidetes bacterium]|nr:hypothetical protein [Bacteroidota bacterium]